MRSVAWALLGVLGCSSENETTPTQPSNPNRCAESAPIAATLELQLVAPADTDPALDGSGQIAVEPHGAPTNKLFVFLGGLNSTPDDYVEIVRVAAAAGHHAIGLSYVNTDGLAAECGADTEQCPCNMRHEVITGEDISPNVDVDFTQSVDHRLVAFLEHLGWSQYIEGNAPHWQDIIIAGHSLGGGNAMMIAKLRLVHRALAISQPWPETRGWLLEAFQTPDDRLWGFVHGDEVDAGEVLMAWDSIGIPGEATNVDNAPSPYGGSHQLVTTFPMSDTHSGVAVDALTPRDAEALPELAQVWCHLIGP